MEFRQNVARQLRGNLELPMTTVVSSELEKLLGDDTNINIAQKVYYSLFGDVFCSENGTRTELLIYEHAFLWYFSQAMKSSHDIGDVTHQVQHELFFQEEELCSSSSELITDPCEIARLNTLFGDTF